MTLGMEVEDIQKSALFNLDLRKEDASLCLTVLTDPVGKPMVVLTDYREATQDD